MPRNIEIKARLADRASVEARIAALADRGPIEIVQDDTFFSCSNGRLKLRAFSPTAGELIFYQRPDQSGPKESFYILTATDAPDSLRQILRLAYGEVGRVRKRRTLFLAGRTRIHLDDVEGLGQFIELEVTLDDGDAPSLGIEIAHDLLGELQIDRDQLLEGAYIDLLGGRFGR